MASSAGANSSMVIAGDDMMARASRGSRRGEGIHQVDLDTNPITQSDSSITGTPPNPWLTSVADFRAACLGIVLTRSVMMFRACPARRLYWRRFRPSNDGSGGGTRTVSGTVRPGSAASAVATGRRRRQVSSVDSIRARRRLPTVVPAARAATSSRRRRRRCSRAGGARRCRRDDGPRMDADPHVSGFAPFPTRSALRMRRCLASRAHRTARCVVRLRRALKYAMRPSPRYLSSVPPCANSTSTMRSRNAFNSSTTAAAGSASQVARSRGRQNRIVTSRARPVVPSAVGSVSCA